MKAYGKQAKFNDAIVALDIPRPIIDDDELLVRVKAIGVGVHDEYFHAPDVAYPYVIGIEGAGVIEEVGSNVQGYDAGDRVAFTSMMQSKGGTLAEYAAVSKDSLILPIPDEMSFEQAAALPVAGNTVLKAIKEVALKSGDSLFIAGGAGALGTLLIQIARQKGYTVIASASVKNHEYMKNLRADYTVDYHDTDWQQQVRDVMPGGVDGAIAIHPGTPHEVQTVVKDGGTLIAVSGDNFRTERDIVLKGVFNTINVRAELQDLIKQIVSGKIKQTIEKVYPFSEAIDALEKVKTRHTRGKLVVSIST